MADHRNGGNHPTASKGAGGALGGYTIDTSTLIRRLKSLYSHWREHRDELWGSCNAFAVATPPPSDDLRYLKSSALNIWLLGYEFPETIMVFSDKQIQFLCSQKEASLLDVVKKSAKGAVSVDVVMHVNAKNDDGLTQMNAILHSIESLDSPVLGYIAKEAPEGKLLEKWTEKMTSSGLQLSDITNGLADLFSVKESGELINVKKAAHLIVSVMNQFVVPKLEKVMGEGKKVTHSSLMDDTKKAILEPDRIKVKLKAGNVDICYPPIFQSGGNFDLRSSATSNDDYLYYDSDSVIICALGSRYTSYCANVARTFLISTNTTQDTAYQVLLKAYEAAVGSLKPGNKASDVYKAALAVVEKEAPELTSNLTKSAGMGIGLEFRESGLSLNERNGKILKAGMVLNVSLGFQNMETKSSKANSQKYALLIADTVVVNATDHEVVTSLSSKAFEDVTYAFDVSKEEDERPQGEVESNHNEALSSKATLRPDNHEKSKEELRRQHQAKLAHLKNAETAQRLAGGKSATGEGRYCSRTSNDLIAYKNINDIPSPIDLMIQVDKRNETILIPLYGSMVPFHVATVKTVISQDDTKRNRYIRIIFNVPETPFAAQDPNSVKSETDIFFKEVSFRSSDRRHISQLVQQIIALRKKFVSRESERAKRASLTLVTQEKLVLAGNKFKSIRLTDLLMRPSFPGCRGKLSGTLEAHENGFRYSTSRADERVDILFGNIKHAFFQPADKELITILHFHLHHNIMVGNKKTKNVQFYVEVMDAAETLGGAKRSAYDPNEVEEEQTERDCKNKINRGFQNFVERVNDLWAQPKFRELDLEFEQPLRELGFHGVPRKASVFIVPTSSCLVQLIEFPFLVVTMSEIEIVNLERVGLGQKNFDMVIVFNDFKRDVLRIYSIPFTSIDGIKDWLDTAEIKYYESRLNMNWRAILKTITDDPQCFIDEGGWEFLNSEASDSDSDGSQESDHGYEPSDVKPESDDNEEEEKDEGSEEDKGKSWDALEREASNADRERGDESDSEEERKRRKMKAFGKSRAGPRSSAPKRPKFRR